MTTHVTKLSAGIGILALFCSMFAIPSASAQAAPNLISNPSVETLSGTSPLDWSKVKWGTNNVTYTVPNEGQNGSKSVKVQMNSRTSGDARWQHKAVTVTPNTDYSFSVAYKSNVASEIDIQTTLTNNTNTYTYLDSISPSPTTWATKTVAFKTDASAKVVSIYLPLSAVGFIQSDSYSLTQSGVTPPPPTPSNKFTRPIISIDFDDGWKNAYTAGFPVLDEFGFKGTQNVITDTIDNVQGYGDSYMTSVQIKDLANRGHRIGSHSQTHPSLTTLNSTQLNNEVVGSKTKLEQITGQSINYFVTPYCDYNPTVVALVKTKYSQGMRNCDEPINYKVGYDKYNLHSFIIFKTTTLTEVQNVIDEVKANNGWVIFMYHEVAPSGDDYSLPAAQLRQQLQLMKNSGVTVLPAPDALNEVNPQI
jgi:peptidoglycan/xylan/chitin deacetylase (PgdA/CDA1 family)